jgi:DNA-binding NarL/FixJ family response regulator
VHDVTVLIADDHSIVRRGLRAIIESQPDLKVVGEAITGREVVQMCEQLHPELAIVDIAMPQLNGIDATEKITKHCPATTVIILSMHSDEAYILRALTAGARAYILKDSAETDLIPAIYAVLRGRPYFSPRVANMLLEDYVRFLRQRGLQDSYDLLTDREKEVLQLIAEGRSNKEVANLLNIGVSTIETHRGNIMQKLDLHSTAEIVLYAMRKRLIT